MRWILVSAALALSVAQANACDKLVVNCTHAALAIDAAQKGPVAADPILNEPGKREAMVRATSNGGS